MAKPIFISTPKDGSVPKPDPAGFVTHDEAQTQDAPGEHTTEEPPKITLIFAEPGIGKSYR